VQFSPTPRELAARRRTRPARFVRFRLQPELAQGIRRALAGGNSPADGRHDADDYTRLIDKLMERPSESPA
jgi:hypothetical protein